MLITYQYYYEVTLEFNCSRRAAGGFWTRDQRDKYV